MKRTITFIIACTLMLTTMSLCVLAADDVDYPVTAIYDEGFLLDEDDRYVDFGEPSDDCVPYGETIYYLLLSNDDFATDSGVAVHESKAVKNVRIKTDWDEGKNYIDELSVVKKKFTGESHLSNVDFISRTNYAYFLAVTTKKRSSTTTDTHDVNGTVSLKKTSTPKIDPDDVFIDFNIEVGFYAPDDTNVIPITPALFERGDHFDEDDEETFDFEADSYSYFVVNTNNQKDIVLGMDTDYDDDIADKYPNANLDFFNGNGARFNKLGYLYLYSEDSNNYIYSIEDDGSLKTVNADYDSYDDCFIIRTRTLGRYLISDRKLAASTVKVEDDEKAVIFDNDTQTNYNPGTGGWGFDEIANDPYYGQSSTPAQQNNTAAITNAVITGSSSSPQNPQDEAGDKTENNEPAVIGTTKKLGDNRLTVPTINGEEYFSLSSFVRNNRSTMIIVCCGVILSCVIGLVICAVIKFLRTRERYY